MTPYYQQNINNAPAPRRFPGQAMASILLVVLTGGMIAAGFIYAIRLHVEAVQCGYQTQKLLRLRQQLEREKRQLELQRAHYRSPEVIENAGRKLGLVPADLSQMIFADSNGEIRKWIPNPNKHTAMKRAPRSDGASTSPGQASTGGRSLPPEVSLTRENDERTPADQTAGEVRSRPKRVEPLAGDATRAQLATQKETEVTVPEDPPTQHPPVPKRETADREKTGTEENPPHDRPRRSP